LEALVVIALIGIVALYTVPGFVTWRQRQQLEGALRHLTQEVTRACSFAAASGRTHAVRFHPAAADLRWELVADGDGDGVSIADIDIGVDAPIESTARLAARFPGVLPGRPAGVPTVAGGAAGTDGVAFGSAALVSCAADGGARSGTRYLRSQGADAGALRVYGPTARLSRWWWNGATRSWTRMP
jgi:type II secretory pathway pseudopilin PulG